jgi:hypothetical protein
MSITANEIPCPKFQAIDMEIGFVPIARFRDGNFEFAPVKLLTARAGKRSHRDHRKLIAERDKSEIKLIDVEGELEDAERKRMLPSVIGGPGGCLRGDALDIPDRLSSRCSTGMPG